MYSIIAARLSERPPAIVETICDVITAIECIYSIFDI